MAGAGVTWAWLRLLGLLGLLVATAVSAKGDEQWRAFKATKHFEKYSWTYEGNVLPQFLFMQTHVEGGSTSVTIGGGRGTPTPFVPDDSCGADIWDGAMEDQRSPQLPYLTQDLWGCEREEADVDVLRMESSALRADLLPSTAGRVLGLYDKLRGREYLYDNKAHQPANIGALKAWAAGGIEPNHSPGIIGHSAFSESPVWVARVETAERDIVRIYEFDRYNGTVWQVDMFIENDTFWWHPKVTNPTDVDLRGYWWTCVAVEAKPTTRVLCPATHNAQTSREPMRDAPWPEFATSIENGSFKGLNGEWPTDNSYLGNILWGDFFLRIPRDEVYTPYVAHTQEDGFVVVHGHPLNGSKFFTWGQNGNARFAQDFLAGGAENREGDYTELQVGPKPTQMQNYALPKQSHLQWTEWFRGFQADPDVVHAGPYQGAVDEIEQWMKAGGMRQEHVQEIDEFFKKHVNDEPAEILFEGMPWGALEEQRLGQRLQPGLQFELPTQDGVEMDEARPWMQLVNNGTFLDDSLARLPLSYQTTDGWLDLLQRSAQAIEQAGGETTWLHDLHIGIGLTERGAVAEPLRYFAQSFSKKPNPIAARCMGVLQSTYEEAWPWYQEAWRVLNDLWVNDPAYTRYMRNFVTEMGFFLQTVDWVDEMETYLRIVPPAYRGLDAYLSTKATVLNAQGKFEDTLAILESECFPTYFSARSDLIDFWNTAVEGLAAEDKGEPLTGGEARNVRVNNPPARAVGCIYAHWYDCPWYW